ncbi:MAG: c(7)-type cytochrome triheme domain-containing protein [Gemmatimonadaceae bacterium]
MSVSGGCSRQALSAFFDLPPAPRVAPVAAAPAAGTATVTVTAESPVVETPPPAFERTLDPDSALKLLPRDHAGNVDWVGALRNGVIRPRPTLPGRTQPDTTGFRFAFDFNFPGPDTTFDAYFPHSTHTEWLSCNTCHARIFPYRGTPIRMADVLTGKYCGECHGKVAFPAVTACERCHVRLKLPANRARAEFIGTITLTRVKADSGSGVIAGNAARVETASLPPARFPHWVHRSRYLCKSCHMELFVPKAGANRITMLDISRGKACGACHDGKTAFSAGFGACDRCHVPPPPPTAAPPAAATAAAAHSTVRSAVSPPRRARHGRD